ncbi:uncharacterized protein CMU_013470 [Cryptosporidium muris RN66]|uniref:Uncharacterized protein n=1 Tax=Cryptosporidium muris (strain RN66) TaxID=441375 RepID=B6AEQ5_CRYMR|nr:uncharacterized protein CMU_013470 [Cryptosporidium muris RN66]EEA06672.1 hypothetical protein CMU_013470 [Cryptosporidium muris RN66]|eukprot:XP_002141021.1 hypothetical protein [Cryptosporidium muris RN66]
MWINNFFGKQWSFLLSVSALSVGFALYNKYSWGISKMEYYIQQKIRRSIQKYVCPLEHYDIVKLQKFEYSHLDYPIMNSKRIAQLNSRFDRKSLSDEMISAVVTYFINIDIAKINGVRKSDVILFITKSIEGGAGINIDDELVTSFLCGVSGKDLSQEERLLSSCDLQEFIDLIDKITHSDVEKYENILNALKSENRNFPSYLHYRYNIAS